MAKTTRSEAQEYLRDNGLSRYEINMLLESAATAPDGKDYEWLVTADLMDVIDWANQLDELR